MSAETTGIPLVVRYNSRGQPDGLKEELNINVDSVSANTYKNLPVSALSSLSDVIITSSNIANNYVLSWQDGTPGRWMPVAPGTGPGGVTQFPQLLDVANYPNPYDGKKILHLTDVVGDPNPIQVTYSTKTIEDIEGLYDLFYPSPRPTTPQVILVDNTSTIARNYTFLGLEETPGTYGSPNTLVKVDSGGGSLTFSTRTDADITNNKKIYDDVNAISSNGSILTRDSTAPNNQIGSIPQSTFVKPTDGITAFGTQVDSSVTAGGNNILISNANNKIASTNIVSTDILTTTSHGTTGDPHTQYVLADGTRSMDTLNVTGNITVGGNVDGVDVGVIGGYFTSLGNNQILYKDAVGNITGKDFILDNLDNVLLPSNIDKFDVLAYDLTANTWKNYGVDGVRTNPKFNANDPNGSGLPELIIHVSGLGTSGFTQRDLLAVGPSGTLVPVSSLLPSINPVPLFEDRGKLIIINEAANDLIGSSEMKWDYTSQGLEVLGDVSAQNYYGNFSGATAELYNISGVSSIQFATDMPAEYAAVEGEVYYDTDAHTLSLKTGEFTTLQVGQEQVIRVKNDSGADILNGTVVYVSGVQGTAAAKLLVGLATASVAEAEQDIIGIATQDIDDDSDGFITTFGIVRGIDTSGYTVGDVLYLDTVAGGFTSTKPLAPYHPIRLGIVLRAHQNEGAVFVNVEGGYDIADLHDVSIQGIQSGDLLRWNGTIFAPSAFDHGTLDGLSDNDHPQYVLSATNQALSSLTTSIQASTVDLSAYIAANETAWSTDTDTTDHGALSGRSDDDHTQYVIKSPTTGARNTIQPTSDVAGLTIQAGLSNTDNLFVIKDGLTADVLTIDLNGDVDTDGNITAAGSVKGNTVSAVSLDASDLSATYSNLALDVIYDHLLPHDQNGNWNGVSNGAGSAYQQNQGGNSWMQAADIQGVMTVSNGNGTASTDAAAKVHVNFSSYLSVGTIHYFRVSTNRTTDIKWRFGVVNESIAATAAPVNGVYFEYDSTQGSNLSGVTAGGSARTFADTGVSVASTMNQAWRWFGIKVISGDGGPAVQFFDVDNDPTTAIAEITTNLPATGTDSAMRTFIQCVGNGATYGALFLDTYGIQIQNGWVPRKIT